MATARRWFIWLKMVIGKSDLHVNQPMGSFIDPTTIAGYYNDFSQKVLIDKRHREQIDFCPTFTTDDGLEVILPTTVAQYALGNYELFMKTKSSLYREKMIYCSSRLRTLVDENGSIPCLWFLKSQQNPYSAMCQGEAISVFARAYQETGDVSYFRLAKSVFSFMTQEKNGLIDDCTNFYEYPDKPLVLNGWIFALFGIYDYWLLTGETEAKALFDRSCKSLANMLPSFCCDSWSFYDLGGNIASPFYQRLHVELLKALEVLGCESLTPFIQEWSTAVENRKIRRKMFWRKAKQKIWKPRNVE